MQELQALLLPPRVGWGIRPQPGIEVVIMTSVHVYEMTENLLQDVIMPNSGLALLQQCLVSDERHQDEVAGPRARQ